MMIDTMLDNDKHTANPLIDGEGNNSFAIKCLLQVPISILHRKHREQIMKAWCPVLGESTSLDSSVLALKIKTMRFPMFYEVRIIVSITSIKTTDSILGNGFPTTFKYGHRPGIFQNCESRCQSGSIQGTFQVNFEVWNPLFGYDHN